MAAQFKVGDRVTTAESTMTGTVSKVQKYGAGQQVTVTYPGDVAHKFRAYDLKLAPPEPAAVPPKKGRRAKQQPVAAFPEQIGLAADHGVTIAVSPPAAEPDFEIIPDVLPGALLEAQAERHAAGRTYDVGRFYIVKRTGQYGKVLSQAGAAVTLEVAASVQDLTVPGSELATLQEFEALVEESKRKAAEPAAGNGAEHKGPYAKEAKQDPVSLIVARHDRYAVAEKVGLGDLRAKYAHLNKGQQAAMVMVQLRTAYRRKPESFAAYGAA
jgi:hypothetical protein